MVIKGRSKTSLPDTPSSPERLNDCEDISGVRGFRRSNITSGRTCNQKTQKFTTVYSAHISFLIGAPSVRNTPGRSSCGGRWLFLRCVTEKTTTCNAYYIHIVAIPRRRRLEENAQHASTLMRLKRHNYYDQLLTITKLGKKCNYPPLIKRLLRC